MSRTRFFVVMLLAAVLAFLGRAATHHAVNWTARARQTAESCGRVQLVLDEQDLGLVSRGMPLRVAFAVANTGSGDLTLCQATEEGGGEQSFDVVTIEAGRTGEAVAELSSDDLLARGHKHVRFHTSDPTCPELWLTVRGAVVRHIASP